MRPSLRSALLKFYLVSFSVIPLLLLAAVPPGGGTAQALSLAPSGGCQPWTLANSVPNPRTHHYLRDIEPLAPNDIWAVGEYYDENNYTEDTALAMHWDGTAWTITPTPPTGKRGNLRGVSALSSDDIWAVGVQYPGSAYIPLILHWDGEEWTEVTAPNRPGGTELYDVVALATDNVWAVGANDGFHSTIVMHWDGTAWTIVPSPNLGTFDDNVLTAVTAVAPDNIWAVGYVYPKGGTPTTLTIRWNGTQWSVVTSPNPGNYFRALYGVSALAADDIWAVGSYSPDLGTTYLPLTLRWNGTQWTHVTTPVFPDYSMLEDVTALAPNDIWAVGTNAVDNFAPFDTLIMHYDGTAWSRVSSPNGFRTFSRLEAVAATSSSDVWAVGFSDNVGFPYTSDSLILRRQCEGGTPTPVQSTATPTAITTSVPATPTSTPTAVSTATSSAASPTASPQGSTATVTAPATSSATATAEPTSPVATHTPIVCAVQFSDVPPDHTFYPFVRCLACQGIVSGYPNNTFRPDNLVTRGQVAKIVALSAGFTEPVSGQAFEDVPVGSTFYEYIQRLAARQVMSGYACGGTTEPCGSGNLPYFRPNSSATRGQLARIVSNAATFTNTIPQGNYIFADVPPQSTFWLYVERLLVNRPDAMQGYPCGGPGEPCDSQARPYFRPNNSLTRGQTSKITASTFFPDCPVK